MVVLLEGTYPPTEAAVWWGEPLFVLTNNGCFLQIKGKKERDRIICEVKDRETEQNRAGKNLQAVLISIPVALRGTLSFITAYSPPETICMQIKLYIWFVLFVALPARFSMQSVSSAVHRCSLICNGCCRLSNPLWSVPLELFTWYVLMFLHFHKLTTELFHSIKSQQISLYNASVGSNANCLCHVLTAN